MDNTHFLLATVDSKLHLLSIDNIITNSILFTINIPVHVVNIPVHVVNLATELVISSIQKFCPFCFKDVA